MDRMRIIAKSTLRAFWEQRPDAEEALQAWYDDAERAIWRTPAEIRMRYSSASFLANNRVVFNIRGNHYRLVVQIHYNTQIVYVRFVGTHGDYNRIDALNV
jgi:mRNA interferase HigB